MVQVSPSTPGVINVTLWNNALASLAPVAAYAPSIYAPLPASPLANPLGSLAVIVLPIEITQTLQKKNQEFNQF